MSSSRTPNATDCSSFSNDTPRFRSSGRVSVLMLSHTPTASTMMKCVFAAASGVTDCSSVGEITRVPRPIICSK